MTTSNEIEAILKGVPDKDVKGGLEMLAKQCEAKLGIPKETVIKDYEAAAKQMATQLKGLDAKTLSQRVFVKVKGKYKAELRSPAAFFKGIVLGVSEPFNMVAKARREAHEVYTTNPSKAVEEGWTDAEGTPLDRKKTYASGAPNRDYGKPLPTQSLIQNVFGVCQKRGEKTWKIFKIMLGDNLAGKVPVPIMKPVVFRANVATNQRDSNVLALNPYSRIQFDVQQEEHDVMDIFEGGLLNHLLAELKDLPDYHKRVASDPQRVVIVQGDVQYISPEPNRSTGNRMMVLDDATLDEDHPGVTCWIPEHLHSVVDFGSGSRVVVVGSTTEAKFQDDVNYLINVTGLYAIPKFKVPADEIPQGVTRRDAQQVR